MTIENHHEGIVSREVWNLAQERLRRSNMHEKGSSYSSRYVFSGKIKCGECGSTFVGRFKYRKDGTRIRRWRCGRAASGGTAACGVGKLLRDEDAMQMFRAALMSLPMEEASIIHNVTELALEAIQDGETGAGDDPKRLELDIEQIQGKKEAVMDSYFSGDIPKSDMLAMNRRYDLQIEDLLQRKLDAERRRRENRDTESLRAALRSEVAGILTGGIMSDVFCKTMLESLTVFHDRHMELRLRFAPMVFRFSE